MIEKSAEKPTLLFIVVMGALSAFGPLAIDMYLPALPTVKEDLGASPFIIQNIYGHTPQQYSYIFAGLACGLIIMAQLTGKLVDYINPQNLLRTFTAIQVVGAILTVIGLSQHLPIAFIIFSLLLVVAPVAGVGSVGFSIAMTNQKRGGSAASFLGLLQYAIGGVSSALVGIKGDANAMPYMVILIVGSVILIVLHFINYRVFKK